MPERPVCPVDPVLPKAPADVSICQTTTHSLTFIGNRLAGGSAHVRAAPRVTCGTREAGLSGGSCVCEQLSDHLSRSDTHCKRLAGGSAHVRAAPGLTCGARAAGLSGGSRASKGSCGCEHLSDHLSLSYTLWQQAYWRKCTCEGSSKSHLWYPRSRSVRWLLRV